MIDWPVVDWPVVDWPVVDWPVADWLVVNWPVDDWLVVRVMSELLAFVLTLSFEYTKGFIVRLRDIRGETDIYNRTISYII